jgi:hypothetical protein
MPTSTPSRRAVLQTTAAAAAVATTSGSLSALQQAPAVHQGGGKLKIGVVGIGGRGSGAAVQAVRAHKENVLHAVGDGTFIADGRKLDRRKAMRSKLPAGV